MLKKSSGILWSLSYKTTWNSHTTPNYEKTFGTLNQRLYHLQTVKLLFLVKHLNSEGLLEKDLKHC